jgi:hypothetical protein
LGAAVTDAMGRQAPEGLIGIHMNLVVTEPPPDVAHPTGTAEERTAAEALTTERQTGFAYFLEQATRPQTIGYALLDSPVALAGWMLDPDTDAYRSEFSGLIETRSLAESSALPRAMVMRGSESTCMAVVIVS